MTTDSLPVLNNKTEEVHAPSGASSRGSHQLACAMGCARKWMLRYRKRVVPNTTSAPIREGTLIHDAVAQRYAERLIAQGKYDTPSWWTGDDVDTVLNKAGAGYPDAIAKARRIYDLYPEYWWELCNEPFEPVAVEEEFFARVGDLDPGGPFPELDDEKVTCRTDLIARKTDTGDLWVIDHKTKGLNFRSGKMWDYNPQGEYALSWQANVNLHILRLWYPEENIAGFMVNRICREPIPNGFDRYALHISPRVYATAPRAMRMAVKRELELDGILNAGESPTPAYWACYSRGFECDYRKLCNADTVEEMNSLFAMHYHSEG